jgi:hypothetical protein
VESEKLNGNFNLYSLEFLDEELKREEESGREKFY